MRSSAVASGIGPRAVSVRSDDERFWLDLADGRILGVPYSRFALLARATSEARRDVVLCDEGRHLHWPQADEDVRVDLLLAYTPPA